MKEISLHTDNKTSRILVGESFGNIEKYLPGRSLVIITDENVNKHYSASFPEGLKIVVKAGESSKSMDAASEIYGQLIRNEVDRRAFILGIGGGIVCDLAGYIASTYLRGISFGFVSTTLLAQVDASIGGKNGINFEGYKNMIGIIRQPDFVICDPEMLKTLEAKEFRMGFAEIVKYAAIYNADLFTYLEENYLDALNHDPDVIRNIISICAGAKSDVVEADENETGERKKLNFGHTFAHAFEKLSGISHGEAVSIGMILAARLSNRLGMINAEDVDRLEKLLKNFGLPVKWDGSCAEVFEIMKRDKKRQGGSIGLVLLDSVGNAAIVEVQLIDLKKWIDDLC